MLAAFGRQMCSHLVRGSVRFLTAAGPLVTLVGARLLHARRPLHAEARWHSRV